MSRPQYLWRYGRVSDPAQLKGHGEQRQEERDWNGFAEQFGFKVHPKPVFDKGKSGYTAENWNDDSELGKFVKEAERGVKVKRGDCLGCENWDRLCRLNPWAAVAKIARLREAGIHLGDVRRGRLIRYDSTDFGEFIDFVLETSRGHSESQIKSDRSDKVWKERRKLAESGQLVLTRMLPCWIRAEPCNEGDEGAKLGGSLKRPQWYRLVFKEPQVDTVRLMLALARQGYGSMRLVREMVKRGIKSPGGKEWSEGWVSRLLQDWRLAGYLDRVRRPAVGAKIIKKDDPACSEQTYYPPLLTEGELLALSAGRGHGPGRRGRDARLPNVFKGLIVDALSGSRYLHQRVKGTAGKPRYVLKTADAKNGRAKEHGFDFQAFEEEMTRHLREIDPDSVTDNGGDAGLVSELSGRLTAAKQEYATVDAYLKENGFTRAVADHARRLEDQIDELTEALAQAVHRAKHPLAEAWGEQKTLLRTLQTAADPVAVRLALRARLQETIERIYLLVIPKGKDRLAAVQVNFKGGDESGFRQYLILFEGANNLPGQARPSRWESVSFRHLGLTDFPDLSKREDAAEWAEALTRSRSAVPSPYLT
jgi:DNA invertase Pin-like site-specific DNA recombinase